MWNGTHPPRSDNNRGPCITFDEHLIHNAMKRDAPYLNLKSVIVYPYIVHRTLGAKCAHHHSNRRSIQNA